jgi:hypothetical protein
MVPMPKRVGFGHGSGWDPKKNGFCFQRKIISKKGERRKTVKNEIGFFHLNIIIFVVV